jgi:hypothetical protein
MSCARFVRWEERETESGIQLQGVTTVYRYGEILSTQAFPMQGASGMGFMITMVVRRLDNDKVVVIDGMGATIVDEPKNDRQSSLTK